MPRQPSVFISRGSPMLALQPGVIGPKLTELGQKLDKPAAVLILSPHWMTRGGVAVGASPSPAIIYDFGGFPAPLYQVKYPASGAGTVGAPALAARVAELLAAGGVPHQLDASYGLDHGAWVPMRYLYPEGDVPVLQLSMPAGLDSAGAYALGQLLAPLAEEGVLIVGSGSLTHNLGEFTQRGAPDPNAVPVEPYVTAFRQWTHTRLLKRDADAMTHYRRLAPHAVRAHPTDEHYLPFLIALGAARTAAKPQLLDGGITYGVIGMDSYLWRP